MVRFDIGKETQPNTLLCLVAAKGFVHSAHRKIALSCSNFCCLISPTMSQRAQISLGLSHEHTCVQGGGMVICLHAAPKEKTLGPEILFKGQNILSPPIKAD